MRSLIETAVLLDPRDKRPEMTSEPLFRVSETANSSSHTRNCAENSDCSPTIRNIQLVKDCVVGSGGLEPPTRRGSSERARGLLHLALRSPRPGSRRAVAHRQFHQVGEGAAESVDLGADVFSVPPLARACRAMAIPFARMVERLTP